MSEITRPDHARVGLALDSQHEVAVMGPADTGADDGHARETINAVIGDLEQARAAISAEPEAGRPAVAAKLVTLAGELADLAHLLLP